MKKHEMHQVYSRHLKKANPFSLLNFGKAGKASERTAERRDSRKRAGILVRTPMQKGTYKNKT